MCVGLLIFIVASGRIELFCNFYRWKRDALDGVQPFFLVERDGKQDGFHRVVARLIGGRLGVGAHAAKQAVEIFLILAAQRAGGAARGEISTSARWRRRSVAGMWERCGPWVSVIHDL
jgi:hypothetical protein